MRGKNVGWAGERDLDTSEDCNNPNDCVRKHVKHNAGTLAECNASALRAARPEKAAQFSASTPPPAGRPKDKKMSIRLSIAVILICGFTALSLAQAPLEAAKPGPEHKRLEYFLGTWKMESEIKTNDFVPAGKGVITDTYTLGPGGFSVELRAEGQTPVTFGIIAYDSHARVYTAFYVDSVGVVGTGTGTVNGNTWTWMIEDKVFGKAVKGRTTVTIKSASQYTLKYEMLDANGRYITIQEGTATKVAP
jgi:hypothetical protein